MSISILVVLRIIHIVAGVLWVGGAAIHTLFIEPTVKATAPESRTFVQYFMGRQRFGLFMNIASGLTILAGAALYWRVSGGFQWAWVRSSAGVIFSIGAVFGLVVYCVGLFLIRPRADRIGTLGRAIGVAGGAPTPGQAAELHRLDQELARIGRVDFVLLMLALLTMSAARYWSYY